MEKIKLTNELVNLRTANAKLRNDYEAELRHRNELYSYLAHKGLMGDAASYLQSVCETKVQNLKSEEVSDSKCQKQEINFLRQDGEEEKVEVNDGIMKFNIGEIEISRIASLLDVTDVEEYGKAVGDLIFGCTQLMAAAINDGVNIETLAPNPDSFYFSKRLLEAFTN